MSVNAVNDSLSYNKPIDVTLIKKNHCFFFKVDLDKTSWQCPTGTFNGIKKEHTWDCIKTIWNYTSSMINWTLHHCCCLKNRQILPYFTYQSTYLNILSLTQKIYQKQFGVVSKSSDYKAYHDHYGSAQSMKGYLHGQAVSNNRILRILARDAIRPIGPLVPSTSKVGLEYKNPTLFTGFVGIEKSTNNDIGRFANGGGYFQGESASGVFITPHYQNRGYSKEAMVAMMVHAFIMAKKNYKVNGEPLTSFSAITDKTNKFMQSIFKQLGAKKQTYTPVKNKYFYKIDKNSLLKIIPTLINVNKMTINGKKYHEYFQEK